VDHWLSTFRSPKNLVSAAERSAAVALLDGGSTVPFIAAIARRRPSASTTRNLRTLDERLRYLPRLEERRTVILDSIREQGSSTMRSRPPIRAADSKSRLRTFICLQAEGGAPRRRSPRRRAWNRSPTCCSRNRKRPVDRPATYVNADKQVADIRPRWKAPRHLVRNASPRTPT